MGKHALDERGLTMIVAAFAGILALVIATRMHRSKAPKMQPPIVGVPTGYIAQPPQPHQTIDWDPLSIYPNWPKQPIVNYPSGLGPSAPLVSSGQFA